MKRFSPVIVAVSAAACIVGIGIGVYFAMTTPAVTIDSDEITNVPTDQVQKDTAGDAQDLKTSTQKEIISNDSAAAHTPSVPVTADDIYAPKPGAPYGRVRPVRTDVNATVAAVHKAIQPATRDARQLTVMAEPTKWDRATYLKNPAAYNDISEPARAFRPAQPAKGMRRLQRIGSNAVRIKQGTTIKLQARTEPGMPVTFTSVDMARFGNQLTSQTVAADKSGIATVDFIAATGTLYDTDIQAASPAASGIIRWVITIAPIVPVFIADAESPLVPPSSPSP